MGRSVLVTGGSRGIGLAVAEAFIQSGDEVTLTGRDPERLASSGASLGARTVVADAGEPGDISALADVFADGVDVVVNNAGASSDGRREPATQWMPTPTTGWRPFASTSWVPC